MIEPSSGNGRRREGLGVELMKGRGRGSEEGVALSKMAALLCELRTFLDGEWNSLTMVGGELWEIKNKKLKYLFKKKNLKTCST